MNLAHRVFFDSSLSHRTESPDAIVNDAQPVCRGESAVTGVGTIRQPLTLDALRSLLHYDAETGVFTWKVAAGRRVRPGDEAGTLDAKEGYIRIHVKGVDYRAHRLAWFYVYGEWPKQDLDHINRKRADNRISNLRCATRQENSQNAVHRNKTGFPGVAWHKSGWRSQIMHCGQAIRLGLYSTKEEAAAAYRCAKRALHPFHVADGAIHETEAERESVIAALARLITWFTREYERTGDFGCKGLADWARSMRDQLIAGRA